MLAELDTINWLRFERRLDVGRDWPWPGTAGPCARFRSASGGSTPPRMATR
jgi:hypothetical protein